MIFLKILTDFLCSIIAFSSCPKSLGISSSKKLARFESLQAYYSIAGSDLEREIIPLLEDEKMGLLVWSPLAGGLLSGKFSRENQDQDPEGSRRSTFEW